MSNPIRHPPRITDQIKSRVGFEVDFVRSARIQCFELVIEHPDSVYLGGRMNIPVNGNFGYHTIGLLNTLDTNINTTIFPTSAVARTFCMVPLL